MIQTKEMECAWCRIEIQSCDETWTIIPSHVEGGYHHIGKIIPTGTPVESKKKSNVGGCLRSPSTVMVVVKLLDELVKLTTISWSTYLRGDSRSGSGRSRRSLGAGSRAAVVLRSVTSRLVARHAHVVRRRGGRAVGGADARVVLRTTPAQADSRVADGVALHLVDGHLSSMAVDELDKAATLARRDLDICYLSKSLEEGSQLVLGDVAGKATDEDGRVIGVGELVHLSGRVKPSVRETSHLTPHLLLLLRHATSHHGAAGAAVMLTVAESVVATAER